jgi:hypothetical protein
MKNRLVIIILVIIISEIVALLSGFLLFLHFSSMPAVKSKVELTTYKQDLLKNKSCFNIKADIELKGETVTIKEDITLERPKTKAILYMPSLNAAITKITKVSSDSGVKGTETKDTNLIITGEVPLTDISVEYEIRLVQGKGTLSYSDNISYLTNFLMTPAVYRNGKPILTYKYPFGDPYIYNINNYYILFNTDKEMNICAPGVKKEHVFGTNKITSFEAENLRDFPAVLYTKANFYSEKYKGINFYYIDSAESKDFVKAAFDFAEGSIGNYPYKSFFVVKAPISLQGMEFSNMVFLSDSCFTNKAKLQSVTYHEVFHQWFYGLIGTDQLNEPFMDEGLVDYLALVLNKDELKTSQTNHSFLDFSNKSLKEYLTREEYYRVAYNNSTAYFDSIHKKLGNDFYRLLKGLYKDKTFKIMYFSDFKEYFHKTFRGK